MSTEKPDWDQPPKRAPRPPKENPGWGPKLNPKQEEAFHSSAKYVLLTGEKGTGKSVGAEFALVRHAYENANALCFIIGITIRTGKEGALYDLENFVLPAWRDGNRYPDFLDGQPHPKAGEYIDEGMGLEYTASQSDPDTKDRIIWIGNIHGGWSKVLILSIPYGAAVEPRIKGPAPSFVYIEELTNCDSDSYFTYPAAQLGRRRGISGPQQFYASANPAGQSHWVYKKWFVESVDEKTGEQDPDFEVIHVPISENIQNLPPGYVERLRQVFKDPIERRRMIDGEWIDRPSGDAIFAPYFMEQIHTCGGGEKGQGWAPIVGNPIIVSLDVGPVNLSIHMMQRVFIVREQRYYWFIFDELNFVGTYTPYARAIPLLLKRMGYWDEKRGTKFRYTLVTADDAFTQVNSDGSFDGMLIERLLNVGRPDNLKYKLRSCPRAKGSVVNRVQLLIDMFLDDSIRISVTCQKTFQMLRSMVSKKPKPGENDLNIGLQPVKSVHLHSFDSATYALYYFMLMPTRFPNQNPDSERESRVVFAGEGR